ncbi:MAG: sugar-transfer associated ATP-grasp domain-containing protein [bacterium]|nr:sugar-transfer associated ATP-grasp domain-containing protein [bacterium]
MMKAKRSLGKIKRATDWSNLKVIYKVSMARLYGVSLDKYLKNKAYMLDNKALKKLGMIINNNRKIIANIEKETGWSKKKINAEVKEAKERGISLYRYNFYRCFELNEKEQKDLVETLEKRDIKREKHKLWYANAIKEKTGVTKEEALEKLDIAKEKGYNYYQFIVSGKYGLSVNELKRLPRRKSVKIISTDTDRKIKEQVRLDEERVKREMNWNEGEIKLDILKAQVNSGCNVHEYYIYNFYKMPFDEQKKYITSEIWRKLYIRYCDYADTWKYFKQKPLFNEKFKKYVKRDWLSVGDMNFNDFSKFIKNKNMLIYKPLDTACGIGIKKYNITKNKLQNRSLYFKLKHYKDGVIEEIIKQHKDMAKLNPSTINTVRVQTIVTNNKVNFLNATVRMGASSKSTTDNFSSGGIMANVDLKTGKIMGNASSKFGGIIKEHPESHVKFNGFQIPCWDKILKTVEEAAQVVKTMPYIGWDVVINEDSSIQLIEGNHDADATFHQYCPAVTEGKGIRDTIDKYIWFDDESKTV